MSLPGHITRFVKAQVDAWLREDELRSMERSYRRCSGQLQVVVSLRDYASNWHSCGCWDSEDEALLLAGQHMRKQRNMSINKALKEAAEGIGQEGTRARIR